MLLLHDLEILCSYPIYRNFCSRKRNMYYPCCLGSLKFSICYRIAHRTARKIWTRSTPTTHTTSNHKTTNRLTVCCKSSLGSRHITPKEDHTPNWVLQRYKKGSVGCVGMRTISRNSWSYWQYVRTWLLLNVMEYQRGRVSFNEFRTSR